jgi:hypothetical protein
VAKQRTRLTLEVRNLAWLKAEVRAGRSRGIGELVDGLIEKARVRKSRHAPTSVVGTIDIGDADPDLLSADAAIRRLFASSRRRSRHLHSSRP